MKNILASFTQKTLPSTAVDAVIPPAVRRTHHPPAEYLYHRTSKLQYPPPPSFSNLRLNDLTPLPRTATRILNKYLFSSPYNPVNCRRRAFQSSPVRKDIFGFGVFSCSIPVFKSFLLSLTRGTLVILPFWYRWKLASYFPRASRTLLMIPMFAMCLVIAIGIDQSPRTHRWRLLLMSEAEEMEWSDRRFEDLIASDGHLIVGTQDPRTQMVKEICDRLMTALDLDSPVSAATWPRSPELVDQTRFGRRVEGSIKRIQSSAIAGSDLLPWKPESNNPEKKLEPNDWELFIIDSPRINAFVLPTKKIFVYTGLLELIENSEELAAAVIAHEVSHVIERHSVENLGFSALSAVIFDAMRGISYALTISFPVVSDSLAFCINYLNDVVVEKAYSRKLETEADELGLMIMARAGYNPSAALKLWNLLNRLEEDPQTCSRNTSIGLAERTPWTRTHPTCKDRELAIQKALPKALKFFHEPQPLSCAPASASVAPVTAPSSSALP
ncbi:hypothetical protein PCANC_03031 [Puccinia coronata f. sp. avenae]|uniref:Peptidase M48 domain-containing protein n=1 Tax=Puccinia coronata f. sp. avenae TaxID=200324 RepID=A0A2N5TBB5_9BASI|nr:hypothetical protein PCASD_14661 [Puccinia coronata f. sp. avenae]PLW42447.1 hypothetical protein PCASD_04626 [Puccinia coronata f. sp. avenae]PLW55942.1 hypothetical protein PCANC_03031 [Puccinia coronata f. sp. avenae]